MNKETITIDRYTKENFVVEVFEEAEMYEAWIFEKSYGVKNLMFGIAKDDMSKDEFVQIVFGNFEQYAKDYINEMEGNEQ